MKDYLRLMRLPNLVFIGIVLWTMNYWVAAPIVHLSGCPTLPWWMFTLITAATILVAAGGYVINDYFDVKIDRINRPDELIVTRTVDKERTMNLFIGLTATGIALGIAAAIAARSMQLGIIFILIPGLLWFYSSAYKRQLIIGNLIIALCTALVPMLIPIAYSSYLPEPMGITKLQISVFVSAFAMFAFLTTWAREIIKDIEDQQGDRELECHTIPVVWGDLRAKIIASALIVLTMALAMYLGGSVIPSIFALPNPMDAPLEWWHMLSSRYLVFGILIPMVCELVLLWRATIPSDYHQAQSLMKFIMFLGLLFSFVILKIL